LSAINFLTFIKKKSWLFTSGILLPFMYQLPRIINELDNYFDDNKNYSLCKKHEIVIEL